MKIRFLFLALVTVALFSACKKSNKQGRYIPKDAGIVFHLNGKSVLTKLPWEDVKKSELFKNVIADSSITELGKKILENPEESGLDIHNDLLFFVVKDSLGGYAAFEAQVKDASKVATMIQAIPEIQISKSGDFTNAVMNDAIVQWNNNLFVFAVDMPEINYNNDLNFDLEDETDIDQNTDKARDLKSLCNAIFELKEDNSLAKDQKFSKLMNETGDAHFWMNNKKIMGDLNELGAAANMFNLDKLYDNSYQTITFNFNDGKINADARTYMNKDIADIMKKYQGNNIKRTMAERIPSDKIALYFGSSFKPEFIRAFIKLVNMEGIVNMGLAMSGLTMDDIIKATNGNLSFAIFDIPTSQPVQTDSTGMETYTKEEVPSFLFAAEVNDKSSLNKLLNTLNKTLQGSDDIHIKSNDNLLAIVSKKSIAQQYLGDNKTKAPFFDRISGSNYGVFVDIKYIIESTGSYVKDSLTKEFQTYNSKLWNDAVLNNAKMNGDNFVYNAELTFQNTSINSLKQLFEFLNKAYLFSKAQDEYRKAQWEDINIEEIPEPTISEPLPE